MDLETWKRTVRGEPPPDSPRAWDLMSGTLTTVSAPVPSVAGTSGNTSLGEGRSAEGEGESPVSTAAMTNSSDDLPRPSSSIVSDTSSEGPKPKRKGKKPGWRTGKKWYRTNITPVVEQEIAALGAMGVSTRVASRALKLSQSAVTRVLHQPNVQELIGRYREVLRSDSLEKAVGVNAKAWTLADEVLDAKDTRGFDAVMRGLYATEKIASSASGEARRIEGTLQIAHADLTEEAKELLKALAEIRGV